MSVLRFPRLEQQPMPRELKPKIYKIGGTWKVKKVSTRACQSAFLLRVMDANTEAGMYCVERNYLENTSG